MEAKADNRMEKDIPPKNASPEKMEGQQEVRPSHDASAQQEVRPSHDASAQQEVRPSHDASAQQEVRPSHDAPAQQPETVSRLENQNKYAFL